MIGIYKITNLVNGKVYIGQTNDTRKRKWSHYEELRKGTHYNDYLQRAWNKYGEENFKFDVIQECKDRDELNYYETYWYNFYCNKIGKHNLYNIGATGNAHNTSDQVRERMRERLLKNPLRYWLGKKRPDVAEMRRKIITKESTREKMRQYHLGKKLTKSAIEKHQKPVIQYDLEGNEIARYKSILEAGEKTKIHYSTISKICCGCKNRKTAGGYIWKFVEGGNNNEQEKI